MEYGPEELFSDCWKSVMDLVSCLGPRKEEVLSDFESICVTRVVFSAPDPRDAFSVGYEAPFVNLFDDGEDSLFWSEGIDITSPSS